MRSARLLVAAVVLSCGAADAGEDWKLQLLGCGDEEPAVRPGLAEALALELGAPSDPARYAVRVRLPCGDESSASVSVEDLATRLESKVELKATPPELWDRVLALVARQLLHDAHRVAQTAVEVAAAPSQPRVEPGEPAAPPPVAAPTTRESDLALRVTLGARLFPARPTGLFGGGLEGAWRWARLGLWAQGTHVGLPAAQINGVLVAAELGAVPFRFRQDSWQVGVGALLEGGWAHSNTAATLAGYHGTSASAPLAGAKVRTELGYRAAELGAVTLSLDVGYDIGLRVNVLTAPAVDLGGFFVDARLGFEL